MNENDEIPEVTVGPEFERKITGWVGKKTDTIIRSADGRDLGRFVPNEEVLLHPWEPHMTEEEFIQKALASPRHKLKDVWARLGVN